jgi:hypothetical protein
MDAFAESAKACAALAGKARTTLNSISEGARSGRLSSTKGQLARAGHSLDELSAALAQLAQDEETLGIAGPNASVSMYTRELTAALAKLGVTATPGPQPYWLVYPAWFKVELNARGAIQVVLNGDRLSTVRPSEAAETIRQTVTEVFQPEKFAALLREIRDLLSRTGAPVGSIALDNVYDILSVEPGGKSARRKELSRGNFYYSVHRLAEAIGENRGVMQFPVANRADVIFFTRQGDSRKYLTVVFDGGPLP